MIVSAEHYKTTFNFRVEDVVDNLRRRPERLYPLQKFTPDSGVIWQEIPATKFDTIEEALAAVKKWCG